MTTGGGKTVACATCHGADLGASTTFRRSSAVRRCTSTASSTTSRSAPATAPWTPLMKGVVAKLTDEDMLSIAAYLATKQP